MKGQLSLFDVTVRFLALFAVLLVWLLAISAMIHYAYGKPPANYDPAYSEWFNTLQVPSSVPTYGGSSCCGVADCRMTDYKTDGDHYVVRIPADIDNGKEKWLAVPPDKILERIDNPTGRGVVCYTPARGIMCFVRTAEG